MTIDYEYHRRAELAERIRDLSNGYRQDIVLRLTQGSIVAHIRAIETDGVQIDARYIQRDYVPWDDIRAVDSGNERTKP